VCFVRALLKCSFGFETKRMMIRVLTLRVRKKSGEG